MDLYTVQMATVEITFLLVGEAWQVQLEVCRGLKFPAFGYLFKVI